MPYGLEGDGPSDTNWLEKRAEDDDDIAEMLETARALNEGRKRSRALGDDARHRCQDVGSGWTIIRENLQARAARHDDVEEAIEERLSELRDLVST